MSGRPFLSPVRVIPIPTLPSLKQIADDIWTRRHESLNDYLTVEAAAAVAVGFDPRNGPLVIADYADNPGALLEAGVNNACFGSMVDSETAQALQTVKVGEKKLVFLSATRPTPHLVVAL